MKSKGFTLIEVLVAVVILGIGVLVISQGYYDLSSIGIQEEKKTLASQMLLDESQRLKLQGIPPRDSQWVDTLGSVPIQFTLTVLDTSKILILAQSHGWSPLKTDAILHRPRECKLSAAIPNQDKNWMPQTSISFAGPLKESLK